MWKDIDINFEMKNNGDIKDMVSESAINNSLTNIFLTMPGTRRMVQPFASNLYNILFEPIDKPTAENIGYILLDSILEWEPRIKVVNINVEPNEKRNTYLITLTYNIINDGTSEVIYRFKTILRAV